MEHRFSCLHRCINKGSLWPTNRSIDYYNIDDDGKEFYRRLVEKLGIRPDQQTNQPTAIESRRLYCQEDIYNWIYSFPLVSQLALISSCFVFYVPPPPEPGLNKGVLRQKLESKGLAKASRRESNFQREGCRHSISICTYISRLVGFLPCSCSGDRCYCEGVSRRLRREAKKCWALFSAWMRNIPVGCGWLAAWQTQRQKCPNSFIKTHGNYGIYVGSFHL